MSVIRKHVAFELKRVFYVYDIPSGIKRGGHAHKTLHQFLWCLSGSVKVHTVNAKEKKKILLCLCHGKACTFRP